MPAEAKVALEVYKDLYEIGEIPPLGHVPKNMYAWAIRKDRHGPPETSMQIEVVPTWTLDSHDVLILVMAAGVNYNGVWAALGTPISPIDGHKNPFHIAGSDASGMTAQAATYATNPPTKPPGTMERITQASRTSVTSASRYSAIPAQTPAIRPRVERRQSFRFIRPLQPV